MEYAGVTSDLIGRTWQHREHVVDGCTKKYGVTRLVLHELHGTMEAAITRQKRIKKWNQRMENPVDRRKQPLLERLVVENYRVKHQVTGFPPSRE